MASKVKKIAFIRLKMSKRELSKTGGFSLFSLQRAKKVVSDNPGLVDFAIGLVFFVLNLPDGQVLFFGEIQITEGLLSILPIKKGFGASSNDLWASTCYLQLARMAGCKTDFLCTLK